MQIHTLHIYSAYMRSAGPGFKSVLTAQLSGLEIFSDFLNSVGKHWNSNVSYLIRYRPMSALAKQKGFALILGPVSFHKDRRRYAHRCTQPDGRQNQEQFLPHPFHITSHQSSYNLTPQSGDTDSVFKHALKGPQ
jgi:hypothetical protein